MFRRNLLTGALVFLCTCFFGASLCAQTRADSTWPMFRHDMHHTGLSPLTGVMDMCFCQWSYTTGGSFRSSPALGDIDEDGKLEVVVGSTDHNVYGLNGEDGSFLWSYGTAGIIATSPALGDIDEDGKLEVVFGSNASIIHALNGEDGSFLWSYSMASYYIESSPALGDIDEDGKLEVIFGATDNKVYALNGEDGSFLWSYTTGSWVRSSPALGDIDGDGKLEVVVGCDDDKVYALNGEDGSFLWSYPTSDGIYSSPALGDIDGDGKLEVVVGSNDKKVYALNGEDGSFLWFYSIGGSFVRSSPALGDIDGDGKLEVVIGSEDYNVYALNGEDGSFLWSYSTGSFVRSSPALGDIDGDGKLEVIIGSTNYNVYGLNGEDGSFLWSYTTGGWVESSPALGDIDGDGNLEVVIGSADYKIYALGEIPPDIALIDSTHNFGDVAVSNFSDWTFKIFNLGNAILDVSSLQNNQVVYQVISPSFPQNILPNDSVAVTVRFTPDTIKTYQDTLSIFSNDPDEGIVYVYLTGNGIDETPPAAPIGLTANGSNPSPWTSDSTFIINWTNPPDLSGIVKSLYKLGFAPTSNYDTTGSMSPAPPDTVYTTTEGGIMLYVWLEDGLGNIDYNNNSSVNLRYDISPPDSFSLISPPDSAYVDTTRPTFIWQATNDTMAGLKFYKVNIEGSFNDSISDTTWTADYDLSEGFHSWYVVAYDSLNHSRQSNQIWTVGVDLTPPSTVTLISPSDGVYLNDSTVNFIWNEASDTLGGVDRYVLQYALDNGFTQGLVETTMVDTSFSAVLSDTIYYWHVKAVDAANNEGVFSTTWQFEVDTQSPSVPTLISPVGGICLSDTLIAFEWSEVIVLSGDEQNNNFGRGWSREIPFSPVCYILEVDTTTNFTSPLIVDTLTATSTIICLYDDFYYWRVKAYDLAGNQGPYANPESFSVDITAPVIDSTTVWSDTSYVGPFPVYSKVTDNSGVDSVLLHFKRIEDPLWVCFEMADSGDGWYYTEITQAYITDDTIKYYIYAKDILQYESTDPPGAPGNYYWFIANLTGIEENITTTRYFSFRLKSSPARGKAVFNLMIPEAAEITLKIYDISGRLIDTPMKGRKSAGVYKISWTSGGSAGVYFYCLESSWERKSGKFILIR